MKQLLLLTILFSLSNFAFSQCNELFISEYVEGYGNNRALEIYNPTNQQIDISQYSVGRFSNGSTEFTGIPIPEGNVIEPYGTFVIVIDKRDITGTGLETPVWNGYQDYGVCTDEVTGDPIIDSLTMDTIFCVQYDDDGQPLIGTTYRAFLDLQGKADVFLCPVYNVNNAMYFNGNDAVALIKGRTFDPSNPMILDVIGVIGEDPQTTINQPAWVNDEGFWVTRDRSLIRLPKIAEGTGLVSSFDEDVFDFSQWDSRPKNYFDNLGIHESECATSSIKNEILENSFEISPNPLGNSSLNIQAEYPIEFVKIYNVQGQLVFSQPSPNGSNTITIELPMLNTGLHTVLVDFGKKGIQLKKLVK